MRHPLALLLTPLILVACAGPRTARAGAVRSAALTDPTPAATARGGDVLDPDPAPPASAPDPGPAQDAPLPARHANLYRRFGVHLGGVLLANIDTVVRINSNYLVGTTLSLERDLGMDSSDSIGRADLYYAFNDHHRLDLAYYDLRRASSRTIDDEITIGDTVYPINTVLSTSLQTRILKLAYRYNFVADDRTSIGVSVGFHGMRVKLGAQESGGAQGADTQAFLPLPVVGIHGAYALSRSWLLRASAELFQVSFDGAGGYVSDVLLAVENDLTDHLGWGVGFNGFQLSAEYPSKGLNAELDYSYQGLMVYLRGFL